MIMVYLNKANNKNEFEIKKSSTKFELFKRILNKIKSWRVECCKIQKNIFIFNNLIFIFNNFLFIFNIFLFMLHKIIYVSIFYFYLKRIYLYGKNKFYVA